MVSENAPQDSFEQARTQPREIPARYVSSATVAVGEGIKFVVTEFKFAPSKFAEEDGSHPNVGQIKAVVLESRAERFVDGQELEVTCKSLGLMALAEANPQPGEVVTLVRREDIGSSVDWGHAIAGREETAEPKQHAGRIGRTPGPATEEPPPVNDADAPSSWGEAAS